MSDAFWNNLPFLIGALGTCVVPGVTALLMWRAHRANIKAAAATRAEVVATRVGLNAVKELVTVATEKVQKIETHTNDMHDKIVALTDKEATARGHLAGKAEGIEEQQRLLRDARPRPADQERPE